MCSLHFDIADWSTKVLEYFCDIEDGFWGCLAAINAPAAFDPCHDDIMRVECLLQSFDILNYSSSLSSNNVGRDVGDLFAVFVGSEDDQIQRLSAVRAVGQKPDGQDPIFLHLISSVL